MEATRATALMNSQRATCSVSRTRRLICSKGGESSRIAGCLRCRPRGDDGVVPRGGLSGCYRFGAVFSDERGGIVVAPDHGHSECDSGSGDHFDMIGDFAVEP